MISIGVFAKPPLAGQVKTRLIPDIGADKAAAVYRYCLEHTLAVVAGCGLDYQVYLSETCDDELLQDEQYALQHGADLGARMYHALRDLLAGSADGALLIGSDCLDLNADLLLRAARELASHELVILPAIDGGYALIGCRMIDPDLFRQVEWSSDGVLEQTLANAQTLGYRVSLLETVRDIDRLQDLEHYPQLLRLITSS